MKTFETKYPDTPLIQKLNGIVKEGTKISVTAKLHTTGANFNISLKGTSVATYDNVPILISIRAGQNPNCIVRNTATKAAWGTNEDTGGMPIRRGIVFNVMIIVMEKSFKILVDGVHFTDYSFRLPIDDINFIYIEGGGTIYSVAEQYDNPNIQDICMLVDNENQEESNKNILNGSSNLSSKKGNNNIYFIFN